MFAALDGADASSLPPGGFWARDFGYAVAEACHRLCLGAGVRRGGVAGAEIEVIFGLLARALNRWLEGNQLFYQTNPARPKKSFGRRCQRAQFLEVAEGAVGHAGEARFVVFEAGERRAACRGRRWGRGIGRRSGGMQLGVETMTCCAQGSGRGQGRTGCVAEVVERA